MCDSHQPANGADSPASFVNDCPRCGHAIRYTHHGITVDNIEVPTVCAGCIDCGSANELEVPDDDSDAAEEAAWTAARR